MKNWNGTLAELELITFDLDGTIAESKSPLDAEMGALLCRLLEIKKVAIASGASFAQFEDQFLAHFPCAKKQLENLYLIPTNGARLYRYSGTWEQIYENKISTADKKRIFDAFEKALTETGFKEPEKVYGILVEDRDSQMTFSAFGSLAPLAVKKDWDLDHSKRGKIVAALSKYIPDFSIRIGGTSSIDVTTAGIDKAFGMNHLMKYLTLSPAQTLYVGDALFPGGNDSSVLTTGVHTREVENLPDTKRFLIGLLS